MTATATTSAPASRRDTASTRSSSGRPKRRTACSAGSKGPMLPGGACSPSWRCPRRRARAARQHRALRSGAACRASFRPSGRRTSRGGVPARSGCGRRRRRRHRRSQHRVARTDRRGWPRLPVCGRQVRSRPGMSDLEPVASELAASEIGRGPWEGAWPTGEHYDLELLADGDRRNVTDNYRYWTVEAIVADLDRHRHPFHVAIENWQHDFNIGSIVRTANAFAAAEVHIVGRRRWNKRGAMVTDRYQHLRHHPTVEDFVAWARETGVAIIGIDNVEGSVPIEHAELPATCVLVFGQEGPGLSDEMGAACESTLAISQFGSTRSMNVGAAAAIAMHAWIRQHAEI